MIDDTIVREWRLQEPCLVAAARPDWLDPFRQEKLGGVTCNPVILDGVLQQVGMVHCVESEDRLHSSSEPAKSDPKYALAVLVSVPGEALRTWRGENVAVGRVAAGHGVSAVTVWATSDDLEALRDRWPEDAAVGPDMSAAMRTTVKAALERLPEMSRGWVGAESRCAWGAEAFEVLALPSAQPPPDELSL